MAPYLHSNSHDMPCDRCSNFYTLAWKIQESYKEPQAQVRHSILPRWLLDHFATFSATRGLHQMEGRLILQ